MGSNPCCYIEFTELSFWRTRASEKLWFSWKLDDSKRKSFLGMSQLLELPLLSTSQLAACQCVKVKRIIIIKIKSKEKAERVLSKRLENWTGYRSLRFWLSQPNLFDKLIPVEKLETVSGIVKRSKTKNWTTNDDDNNDDDGNDNDVDGNGDCFWRLS